jgi:hypothetical protein
MDMTLTKMLKPTSKLMDDISKLKIENLCLKSKITTLEVDQERLRIQLKEQQGLTKEFKYQLFGCFQKFASGKHEHKMQGAQIQKSKKRVIL